MQSPKSTLLPAAAAFAASAGVACGQVEHLAPFDVPPGPYGILLSFTNTVPPGADHTEFQFDGAADSLGAPDPHALVIDFEWLNPDGTTGLSPDNVFTMRPYMTNFIDTGIFTLPFCPTTVSVHLYAGGMGASVTGDFRHESIATPAPSGAAVLAVAGAALTILRRRR